jgi:hypothetical protein
MIKNLKINKILWLLASCLSLISALTGVFNPNIYGKVISNNMLPGVIAQDATTIMVGLLLLFLCWKTNEAEIKKQIIAISLLGYLFYASGVYVIERLYNSFYLFYMAIFALSFWSIVYGLSNINSDVLQNLRVSKLVRYLSAGYLIFIALLFYPLWIGKLFPLMQTGEKIEFLYSIFILDMVFVLPASIISAILIIQRKALGMILAPLFFLKGFTLLFSVGLTGVLMPFYNQTFNPGETAFYLILSVVFLALGILNLWKINFRNITNNKEKIKVAS